MALTRHIVYALLVASCLVTCRQSGALARKAEREEYRLVTNPPWSRLSAKMITVLTLGHKALYDDFITIWAVQFLGDPELKAKTSPQELSAALNTIAAHQPKIESFYLLGCFALAIDFKYPDGCEYISILGLKTFPQSWRIPMTQGFVSTLIEENDLKASAFYQLAASRPKSPPYVAKLAARLAQRGFADGQDLNETAQLFKEVPGGTKLISILREKLKNTPTPPRADATEGDSP